MTVIRLISINENKGLYNEKTGSRHGWNAMCDCAIIEAVLLKGLKVRGACAIVRLSEHFL